jgi:hypothetical protein
MKMKMGRRKRTRKTLGIRARQRVFMRRSVWALSALSLLAFVPIVASDHGRQMASAVAAAIADPTALLDQRSPGARAAGALTQTKQRRLAGRNGRTGNAREPFVPVERVLAGERRRPGDGVNIPGFAPAGGVETPLPGDAPPPVGDAFLPPAGVTGGGGSSVPVAPIIGGGGGGSGIGGGGGGGGSTPTPPPTPTPTPAPSPVPEPATWLLTLTGFTALATALRRRRRLDQARPEQA